MLPTPGESELRDLSTKDAAEVAADNASHASGVRSNPLSNLPRILRRSFRFVILFASLLQAMLGMTLLTWRNGGRLTTRQRAEQLQRSCRLLLRRLSVQLEVHGQPPAKGLVVTNHLSHIDVLALGATIPCAFVSKMEVKSWPIFGMAGALAGCVFVDRSRSAIGSGATARVEQILREGVAVLLFPEGTSTDGSEILPFHPSFYEPAVVAHSPVTAGAIMYPDGDDYIERDLCYYGDIAFFPRLLQTLGFRSVCARLDFSPNSVIYDNRRTAVLKTRGEVIELRTAQRQSIAAEFRDTPEISGVVAD